MDNLDNRKKVCPICRGGVFLIHKGTRDDNTINVYKCYECETKFLSVLEEDNNYEQGFMHGTDKLLDSEIEKRVYLCQKDDIRRYEMIKTICEGKKILDFGCGFGGFLHYISKVADSYSGVELGSIEREYLKKKEISCFRTIEECNEKFDVITLFHVFEHLSNPKMWLEKFSNYLKKGGYLVIEVPNADDILLSLYESKAFADFTYWSAHLFLYTVKSLTMIINESDKYHILSNDQIQRYSIANHLMWLAKGKPNGHNIWNYLESEELKEAYVKKLQSLNMCDTLFFVLQMK